MTIGFWNINRKNLSDNLVDLVTEQQIDILILAEASDQTILDFITKNNLINPTRQFNQVSSSNEKLTLLTTYDSSLFVNKSNLYHSPRWTVHHIKMPTTIELNLFSIHFHSKVNWSDASLALECVNLSKDIETIERQTGCTETVLIGDFNMNPFENGVVAANGVHAIQDLDYSHKRRSGRGIDGIKYTYFYNPMWNFFGDHTQPFGTHYHRTAGHISQEWNIYDQVIIRPTLKRHLQGKYVKIVNTVGGENLTSIYYRPDKKNYSDHLPITLQLTI